MSSYSERVGSEIVNGVSLRDVLSESSFGASIAAESTAHGAVVVELLDAELSGALGGSFIEGARRAAELDHPAHIPILADGMSRRGEAYVIRPRFEGERASDLVRRRPARIPPVEALRIVVDLLDVLAAAHSCGMVHGGLTTAETFISEDGSVRLLGLGFGQVRRRIAEERAMLPLAAGFAAPERIADPRRAPDEAADVWSAGALLFALLSGEVPYEGTTDAEHRASALERPPRSLTELFGDTPIVLARIVDTALDPDPARRFPAARMRSVAREIAQLPELFLLRDLRSKNTPSPVSGPRRSPSAELEKNQRASSPAPPPSSRPNLRALAPTVRPDEIAIAFRTAETLPAPAPPTARRAAADTLPAMPTVDTTPPSALRRRIADVLVGEATSSEADVRALEELFQGFGAVLMARDAEPAGYGAALEELSRHVQGVLEATEGGFVWNVAPWGFIAGEHAIWEPSEPLVRLPYRLYRDGLRSFGLLHGIELAELERFFEILGLPDEFASPEDDPVTLLYEAGFEHVVFRAVEPRAARSGERRHDTLRERQQIIALAGFDTSSQLEECWHDSHKGAQASHVEPVPKPSKDRDPAALRGLAERFHAEAGAAPERVHGAALAALSVPFAERAVASHLALALDAIAEAEPERALDSIQRLLEESDQLADRLAPRTVFVLLRQSAAISAAATSVLSELIARLDARHAEALASALPHVADPALAARIEHVLASGMSGHEASLGALLARAERGTALWLSRLLSRIDTLAAKQALARALENPDPLVRVEALGQSEGPSSERVRAELGLLLEKAEPAARLAALEDIERHALRIAAPFLALRIRSKEFDSLSIDERRQLFATLARLAPARAETLALEVLRENRLVSLPAHEETRALAADVLGELASSDEVLDALDEEARRFWRTSERVRSAAARARDEVARKSGPPGTREGGAT